MSGKKRSPEMSRSPASPNGNEKNRRRRLYPRRLCRAGRRRNRETGRKSQMGPALQNRASRAGTLPDPHPPHPPHPPPLPPHPPHPPNPEKQNERQHPHPPTHPTHPTHPSPVPPAAKLLGLDQINFKDESVNIRRNENSLPIGNPKAWLGQTKERDLAVSIMTDGIQQPIGVALPPGAEQYLIVRGGRTRCMVAEHLWKLVLSGECETR